jgi:hypothetical protein
MSQTRGAEVNCEATSVAPSRDRRVVFDSPPEPAQPVARGLNSSQVAEPRITPRSSLHPPIASGGNMYLQRSQRTSASGAFR